MKTALKLDTRPIAGDEKLFLEDLGYKIIEDREQAGRWILKSPSDKCDVIYESAGGALDGAWTDAAALAMKVWKMSSRQWSALNFTQQRNTITSALSNASNGDSESDYGPECVIPLANGRTMNTPAYPLDCEYVRIVQDGREVAYWDQAEWASDPAIVMGAIMGAANGGNITHALTEHPRG